jgi:hypothetical protein
MNDKQHYVADQTDRLPTILIWVRVGAADGQRVIEHMLRRLEARA